MLDLGGALQVTAALQLDGALRCRTGVLIEPIGEGWAAFSAASGQTHFLNDAAASILELLAERSESSSQLVERLASEMQVPEDSLAMPVESALATLIANGLVEPVAITTRE